VTGALISTVNGPAGGGGGGGSGNHPNALSWSNPYGFTIASTQVLTISGVGTGSAPIATTNSGVALLTCVLNGDSFRYTGAFLVSDGDTLGWSLLNLTSSTETGSVVVSSGTFTVDVFAYVVRGNTD
jgi:hypothetical protein